MLGTRKTKQRFVCYAVASFTLPVRFPGQYADLETGLHYNFFRTYDPVTGRYLEADPIGQAAGLHLYAYVGSSPVMLTDPSGLEVRYGRQVISNPAVRRSLEAMDRATPGQDVVVTGGDHYRDETGSIRSRSTDEAIPGSARGTQHLEENGATAADFKFDPPMCASDGFLRRFWDYVKDDYPYDNNWHIHADNRRGKNDPALDWLSP